MHLISLGQTHIFWGIEFGTNRDSVLKFIKETKFIVPTSQEGYQVNYTNVNWENHRAGKISLFFCDGIFCEGVISFNKPVLYTDDELMNLYVEIKNRLMEKFGMPTKSYSPNMAWKKQDEWEYNDSSKYQSNEIAIELSTDNEVSITYETPAFSDFLDQNKK